MTKHTPGPWSAIQFQRSYPGYEKHGVGLIGYQVVDQAGVVVCESYPQPWAVHVNEANSKLMAASPDLLELLDWASRKLDQCKAVIPHYQWDEKAFAKCRSIVDSLKG